MVVVMEKWSLGSFGGLVGYEVRMNSENYSIQPWMTGRMVLTSYRAQRTT